MGLLDDLDKRREREQQDRNNAARLAQAYGSCVTTGQGTQQFAKRIAFGVTFVEKPFVNYASVVDIDELAEELDIEDSDECPLPVTAGYVVRWDQDDRDFYVGAWVAVRVNFPAVDLIDADVTPTIEHHFTFAAVAMKDIPITTEDEEN